MIRETQKRKSSSRQGVEEEKGMGGARISPSGHAPCNLPLPTRLHFLIANYLEAPIIQSLPKSPEYESMRWACLDINHNNAGLTVITEPIKKQTDLSGLKKQGRAFTF